MVYVNADYFKVVDFEVKIVQETCKIIVVVKNVVDKEGDVVLDLKILTSKVVKELKILDFEMEVYFHLKDVQAIVFKIVKVIKEN